MFYNKRVSPIFFSTIFGNGCNFILPCVISPPFVFSRNLADHDKDGRLTADEFVVAMHCCEIVRAGQTLPTTLPDDWLSNTRTPPKSTTPSSFASLNQQLKETFGTGSATPPPNATPSAGEMSEAEQKAAHVTYEEKRLKNYEVKFSRIGNDGRFNGDEFRFRRTETKN